MIAGEKEQDLIFQWHRHTVWLWQPILIGFEVWCISKNVESKECLCLALTTRLAFESFRSTIVKDRIEHRGRFESDESFVPFKSTSYSPSFYSVYVKQDRSNMWSLYLCLHVPSVLSTKFQSWLPITNRRDSESHFLRWPSTWTDRKSPLPRRPRGRSHALPAGLFNFSKNFDEFAPLWRQRINASTDTLTDNLIFKKARSRPIKRDRAECDFQRTNFLRKARLLTDHHATSHRVSHACPLFSTCWVRKF